MDRKNAERPRGAGFRAWFRHAFGIASYDEDSLVPEERELLDNLATQIHARQMTAPAIMFIESNRHMNFLGSQFLVMAEPVLDLASPYLNPILRRFGMYVPVAELPRLQAALEQRYSIEYLVSRLEHYAAADYNNHSAADETK